LRGEKLPIEEKPQWGKNLETPRILPHQPHRNHKEHAGSLPDYPHKFVIRIITNLDNLPLFFIKDVCSMIKDHITSFAVI
jgi:hypothetical protein